MDVRIQVVFNPERFGSVDVYYAQMQTISDPVTVRQIARRLFTSWNFYRIAARKSQKALFEQIQPRFLRAQLFYDNPDVTQQDKQVSMKRPS